jgi:chorismate mutase / prephenate dehydratase
LPELKSPDEQPSLTLPVLRDAIDDIDGQLLELLNQRAALAGRIGQAKASLPEPMPFHVPSRERAIVERLEAQNKGPFPSSALKLVFQEIFSACLSLEKGVRVAFLGPEGTFSHEAVKFHFGLSAKTLPCGTVTEVFSSVERGVADYGVVPVENATEGLVDPTIESFLLSNLNICAEIVLPVRHGISVRPGLAMADIQRVYSHPMALAQCRQWLASNLPRADKIESTSTSEAVRLAREDVNGAAISSSLAAQLWGMELVRESIQDFAQNATRFFILGSVKGTPTSADRTTVVATLKDSPGALLGLLQPLAQRHISLCRIESRPTRWKVWDYAFFLELEGHRDEPEVSAALEEMRTHCTSLKILCSYPRAFDASPKKES